MRKARVAARFEAVSPHVTGGTGEDKENLEDSCVAAEIRIGSVSWHYCRMTQLAGPR
jgi:hypothetical protein